MLGLDRGDLFQGYLLREKLCPHAVLHPEPRKYQPIMDLCISQVKSASNYKLKQYTWSDTQSLFNFTGTYTSLLQPMENKFPCRINRLNHQTGLSILKFHTQQPFPDSSVAPGVTLAA